VRRLYRKKLLGAALIGGRRLLEEGKFETPFLRDSQLAILILFPKILKPRID